MVYGLVEEETETTGNHDFYHRKHSRAFLLVPTIPESPDQTLPAHNERQLPAIKQEETTIF